MDRLRIALHVSFAAGVLLLLLLSNRSAFAHGGGIGAYGGHNDTQKATTTPITGLAPVERSIPKLTRLQPGASAHKERPFGAESVVSSVGASMLV